MGHFFTRWRSLSSHNIGYQNGRSLLLDGVEYPDSRDNRSPKEHREECDEKLFHTDPFISEKCTVARNKPQTYGCDNSASGGWFNQK
jgi:hypothetical protein